jgi:DNA helicase-4
LQKNNIRYEYEKSATEISSNRRISRPDFFLSDHDVYVEYWGMVNTEHDHTRQEYIKGMEWKISKYHENGIKFISIYPEDLSNLDFVFRKRLGEIMDPHKRG